MLGPLMFPEADHGRVGEQIGPGDVHRRFQITDLVFIEMPRVVAIERTCRLKENDPRIDKSLLHRWTDALLHRKQIQTNQLYNKQINTTLKCVCYVPCVCLSVGHRPCSVQVFTPFGITYEAKLKDLWHDGFCQKFKVRLALLKERIVLQYMRQMGRMNGRSFANKNRLVSKSRKLASWEYRGRDNYNAS